MQDMSPAASSSIDTCPLVGVPLHDRSAPSHNTAEDSDTSVLSAASCLAEGYGCRHAGTAVDAQPVGVPGSRTLPRSYVNVNMSISSSAHSISNNDLDRHNWMEQRISTPNADFCLRRAHAFFVCRPHLQAYRGHCLAVRPLPWEREVREPSARVRHVHCWVYRGHT